ncbi:MAG: peptidase M14 [Gemmatimonadetes bacterium]|nr:peptidase M14 [Gemmatimonadota bacterium]
MKTRPFRTLALASIGAFALACSPVRPGGSPASPVPARTGAWEDLYEDVRLDGLEDRRFDQERFWRVVRPVVEGSNRFSVEVVGQSSEGRPLRVISFGRGPTSVLLWSQMHGDESTATMALADIYSLVEEESGNRMVRSILGGLTVHTIPMLNPDGAQRFQRRNAQGIDINRDARALATPEARVLKSVRDRVEPLVGFNLHDQGVGTRVGLTDRGAAISLLSPPFDHSRAVNDVRLRAMEIMGVMIRTIEPMVGNHITRYSDTFNPRAFGDLITQWGTSTILVESGGWEGDPQKQYLRKVNFVGLMAALESIASGSYQGVGTDAYQALPANGRRIGDLLITGGTVVIPDIPSYRADLLVNYEKPLLEEEGTFADIGDLAEVEARDTLVLDGVYIHPRDRALERTEDGIQLKVGAQAYFTVSRRVDGRDPLWVFRGTPPEELRRRR